MKSGSSSVGRATAFQAVGREFEPRLPLFTGRCSSVVERFLGKEEVTGSNPVIGSVEKKRLNNIKPYLVGLFACKERQKRII